MVAALSLVDQVRVVCTKILLQMILIGCVC